MTRVKQRGPEKSLRQTQVEKAVREFQRRQYTFINRTASAFGVLYSTLYDRLKLGFKPKKIAHEGQMLFSLAEEKSIVKWIVALDDQGFPPRVSMICNLDLILLAKKKHRHTETIGKHFITRFLDRHPILTTKFSNQVHRQRALASKPSIISKHFDKLHKIMSARGITPERTYNMDEKGILMGIASRAKVICRRGRRNPILVQGLLQYQA